MKYFVSVLFILALVCGGIACLCFSDCGQQIDNPSDNIVKADPCGKCKNGLDNGVCKNCMENFDALSLSDKIDRFDNFNVPAHRLLNAIAAEWEKTFSAPGYGNKKYFDNLRIVCRKIRNIENNEIKKSKIGRFAEEYENFYKSDICVRATSVKFRKDPETKGRLKLHRCFLGAGKSTSFTVEIAREAENKEIEKSLYCSIDIRPWETPYFWVQFDRGMTEANHTARIYFNPHTQKSFDCAGKEDVHGFAYLTVNCEIVIGETFPGLINRIFGTETPDAAVLAAVE